MPATPRERVVLVTGAAKRLGREIALALARDGWHVAVHYRDSVEEAHRTSAECAKLSGNSMSFRTNLANETAVQNLLPSVIAHFGHVDAVVNSASTFEHDSTADLRLRRDGKAHAQQCRCGHPAGAGPARPYPAPAQRPAPAARLPNRQAQGVVVNLLDQKLWNQNPDFISYTLSKAALEAATTMLALALAPAVRVVGVAPGLTLTSDLISDEQFKERHKLALLDQSSTPADVAATVRFALENRSITGTSLLVDGGQHLMRFTRDFSLM